MLIALDGPAASGKGTLARALAARYGLPHLDTGLLYRAVARACLDRGTDLADAEEASRLAGALDLAALPEGRLRGAAVGEAASRVSAHPGVRAALLGVQRAFAARPGGAVLDGRDIGTVIAPHAEAKLYVTASAPVRARRRHAELLARGEAAVLAEVLADIERRDARDAGRAEAPLARAPDATLLDTSDLDKEAALEAAIRIVEAARSGGR